MFWCGYNVIMLLQGEGEEDQGLTTPCWQQQRNMSDLYTEADWWFWKLFYQVWSSPLRTGRNNCVFFSWFKSAVKQLSQKYLYNCVLWPTVNMSFSLRKKYVSTGELGQFLESCACYYHGIDLIGIITRLSQSPFVQHLSFRQTRRETDLTA